MNGVEQWKAHLESLGHVGQVAQAWCEGFICGLAHGGMITAGEEDELMTWLIEANKDRKD